MCLPGLNLDIGRKFAYIGHFHYLTGLGIEREVAVDVGCRCELGALDYDCGSGQRFTVGVGHSAGHLRGSGHECR